MKTWTDEELIAILRESKEWKDCVDSCRVRWGVAVAAATDGVTSHVLKSEAHRLENFDASYQPLLKALRALAGEVKSGAIFGSKVYCAICGTGGVAIQEGYRHEDGVSYFRHDSCLLHTKPAILPWLFGRTFSVADMAIAIVRARAMYRTAGKQDCSTCIYSGGSCPLDQSIPGHCNYSPTTTTCGICSGPVAFDKERDVYHCRHCNAEALGAPIRYQPDKVKWVRYPHKADEMSPPAGCGPISSTKESTSPSTPPASKAPIAPEDIQYPVECKTLTEKYDWFRRTYGGSKSVLCWKCRKPHDPNDGSWISSGSDLRPLDAGCSANFDIWSVAQMLKCAERELEREQSEREAFERWVEKQHRRNRGPDPKVVLVGLDDVFDPRRRH